MYPGQHIHPRFYKLWCRLLHDKKYLFKETFGKTTLIEWAVYSTKVTNKNDVHHHTEHKKLNMDRYFQTIFLFF